MCGILLPNKKISRSFLGAAELFTIKCGGWALKVLAEVLGDGYLRHASWHSLKGIVNESAAGIFLIHNAFFIAEHILGQRKCRRKSAEFAYLRSFFSIFSHVITSQSRYGIFATTIILSQNSQNVNTEYCKQWKKVRSRLKMPRITLQVRLFILRFS